MPSVWVAMTESVVMETQEQAEPFPDPVNHVWGTRRMIEYFAALLLLAAFAMLIAAGVLWQQNRSMDAALGFGGLAVQIAIGLGIVGLSVSHRR